MDWKNESPEQLLLPLDGCSTVPISFVTNTPLTHEES